MRVDVRTTFNDTEKKFVTIGMHHFGQQLIHHSAVDFCVYFLTERRILMDYDFGILTIREFPERACTSSLQALSKKWFQEFNFVTFSWKLNIHVKYQGKIPT